MTSLWYGPWLLWPFSPVPTQNDKIYPYQVTCHFLICHLFLSSLPPHILYSLFYLERPPSFAPFNSQSPGKFLFTRQNPALISLLLETLLGTFPKKSWLLHSSSVYRTLSQHLSHNAVMFYISTSLVLSLTPRGQKVGLIHHCIPSAWHVRDAQWMLVEWTNKWINHNT